MILKTRVFELCPERYRNLSELAQAMGISVSQIYRVREGKRHINQKFFIGAIKAFPERKLDDLFYFEWATVTTAHHKALRLTSISRQRKTRQLALSSKESK